MEQDERRNDDYAILKKMVLFCFHVLDIATYFR